MDFIRKLCYNLSMKAIHRENTEVRKHYTVTKSSTGCGNAKLLYAGELKKTADWKEQPHTHPFCEIVYVKAGTGVLYTERGEIPIREGDLLVYDAETPHSESSAGKEELALYFCGISRLHLNGKAENVILGKELSPVLHTGTQKTDFERYFSALIAEVQDKLYYYDEISRSLVKIILNCILRLLVQNNEDTFRTNECYRSARRFIDENYERIESVEEICKSMYISRYYLTHLFKEYSGMSPIQYIIAKRMEKAKQLLTATALPIHKIAERTGYAEVPSFLKTFKKMENMTPSQYRRQNKK